MLHVSNMSSDPLTLTILMMPTNQTAAEYTGVVRIPRKDFSYNYIHKITDLVQIAPYTSCSFIEQVHYYYPLLYIHLCHFECMK